MKKTGTPPVSSTAAPVPGSARIRSIDTLRGFALFGVLAMNMQAFADVFAGYMHPFALGEISTADYVLWCVHRVLADAKFISIFSMLFGAGIVLMTRRSQERSGRAWAVHYRRMGWLLLFGTAHGILLWTGDILLSYAILGMVAFPMRRFWTWVQVVLALFFLSVTALFMSFLHEMPAAELKELAHMWEPTAEKIEETRAAMRGGLSDQIAFRFEEWKGMFGFLFFFGWRILSCMLLGMVLLKHGVFSAARNTSFYVIMVAAGFGLGLPLSAWSIYDHEASGWDMARSMGIGSLFNYFGSLFAAFGWIGLVMLACRTGFLPGLRSRLASVGRMALTNYIVQSVVCTTIYNGHGLGLYGRVDRVWQEVLIFAIFALQLWYSPLWLQRFRFGPLEWLWRSLTYWRLQPLLRAEDR